MTTTEALVLLTSDGVVLEGEYAAPGANVQGCVVLCHPHPQFGGTMRSVVISALFDALPSAGYACVRFNFRGVEGSAGTYSGGDLEPEDVRAALDHATGLSVPGPLVLAGWSFGADMALSIDDARVAGWIGIAPPLRFAHASTRLAHDVRPKHLVLAQHDEFREPADVQAEVASWTNTTTEIISGASHFFIGRTDQVVAASLAFLAVMPRG
jgi:alpha/beta superfamily hydrolase